MPARAMSGVLIFVMSRPSNRMLPRLAFHRPMMVRRVVVLPAPLRPSRTVRPPRGTARSTPCRMWYWPMWVWTPDSVRMGSFIGRSCGFGCAKISLLHDLRLHHLGGGAVGHQGAVVQHDDAVGQRAHHVHLVLDQQHGLVRVALDLLD